MEQNIIYIAEHDKADGNNFCVSFPVRSIGDNGIITLEDYSTVYSSELDEAIDEGDFIICCSYDKATAVDNVAKRAYAFHAACIVELAKTFDI